MENKKATENITDQKINEDKSVIKIGTFELQTKSFWLGLVGILTLFMTAYFYINAIFWYKINKEIVESNKALIQVVNTHLSSISK